MELVINYHCGDIQLFRDRKNGGDIYRISVEGYIGFRDIKSFVKLYEGFLNELKLRLLINGISVSIKKQKYGSGQKVVLSTEDCEGGGEWRVIYKTKDMDICYHVDCYWVFLKPYESDNIYEIYNYMEDAIAQINYFAESSQ